jgi:hypothetical protein
VQSNLTGTYNNKINLFTNPPYYYVINPEQEAKQIEEILIDEGTDTLDPQ